MALLSICEGRKALLLSGSMELARENGEEQVDINVNFLIGQDNVQYQCLCVLAILAPRLDFKIYKGTSVCSAIAR